MVQLNNLIKAAINSILKNKMRSLLTALGIIIGVAAVIVMVAIGKGASNRIQEHISSLGTDMIMIFPGSSRMGGVSRGSGTFNRFTMDDVKDLREQATLIKAISSMVRTGAQVVGGGNNWNTQVNGVDPEYQYIRNYKMEYGEFFSDRNVRSRKKVAVLGKTVSDELFPNYNPVGEKIRINKTPFMVIGVLEEKGTSGMGGDQDDVILVPSTTALYRLKGGRYIDMIYVSAISKDRMYDSAQELTNIMRELHRIQKGDADDFRVLNQAEIIDMASSTTKTLTILLGSIATVSLIVGGIGIMNIMLVSVTERIREIGIRLSVGARSQDILIQFLAESVVLSLIGGIIGILLAFIVSFAMGKFTSFTTQIDPTIIILAFSFSGAVGIFFGFYPARKAALLNPIDALRYE